MRKVDHAKRLRFIELVLSNAKNSDMMKEFGMSIQGVKWWLGKIYKELGVKDKKAMIASRSKFCGDLNEFIAYRERQARLGLVEKYIKAKKDQRPLADLPKWSKIAQIIRKNQDRELDLKRQTEIPLLPKGANP